VLRWFWGAAWRIAAGLLIVLLATLAGFRIAAAMREGAVEVPPRLTMVDTPYGKVAADISGPADGPRVLLVHGSAGWSGFWSVVSAHLAGEGWRVIAVDVPPFGYSDHDPQGRYDRITQAERLAAVLRETGGKAVVVGHSFGAGAATELALAAPELVGQLVLVDAALGGLDLPDGAGMASDVLRFAPLGQAVTSASITNLLATERLLESFIHRKEAAASWVATVQQPMRRDGSTAAYSEWLPELLSRNEGALSRRSDNLRRIAMPVRLIWGREDTVTPPEQAEKLAALFDAPVEWLADVGHIPHIEAPAAFMAALDRAIGPGRGRAASPAGSEGSGLAAGPVQ
jgi:pimeloyl-ACP methyl ester carboxylesterase